MPQLTNAVIYQHNEAERYAGIVAEEPDQTDRNQRVSITVFTRQGTMWFDDVPFSEEPAAGCWSWPGGGDARADEEPAPAAEEGGGEDPGA